MSRPLDTTFELHIALTSPALLGGRLGPGGIAETWTVRSGKAGQRALLPGPALRGVLRHASLRFARARGVACLRRDASGEGRSREPATDGATSPEANGSCSCPTCELFGGRGQPGRLHVRSAVAERPAFVETTRVAIDRQRRNAKTDALWAARRVLASFSARVELESAASPSDGPDVALEHLRALLGWLEATGLALGQSKSTGGQAQVQVSSRLPQPRVSAAVATRAPIRRRLRIVALEPVRLGGLRDRAFFQHGYAAIPAPTLVGALGWAFVRARRNDLATALFDDPSVEGTGWVSEAWPPGPNGAEWRASLRNCQVCGEVYDVATDLVVAAYNGVAAKFVCPNQGCGADESAQRQLERSGARMAVSGHTEIEVGSGRVREGRLFQQQLCEPHVSFEADLLIPQWAADAINELAELTVGGGRRRGLGRVEVSVLDPVPQPDLGAHLRTISDALGVELDEGDEIWIFDVLTAAHVGEPIKRVLRRRGVEILTGEAVVHVLGGWDERHRRTRSLREVIARGSWMALRGPREVLASLDGVVVDDREGWCPLWLRVRSDLAADAGSRRCDDESDDEEG